MTRGIAFVLVCLILGAAAELALRSWLPFLRYYDHGPGVTGGAPVVKNTLGMREVEFPLEKPPGELRVLCMGDSTTFAMSERVEDSWPKILERRLRPHHPNVFVINGAGAGRHPHLQLALFREQYYQIGADVVMLGFCMNDVVIRTTQLDQERYAQPAPETPFRVRLLQWSAPVRSLLTRLYVFGFAQYVGSRFFPLYSGADLLQHFSYEFNAFGATADSEAAWRDTLASLDALAAEVRKTGAHFVIVPIPYRFMLSDEPRDNPRRIPTDVFTIDPIAVLREFAAARAIPIVDSLGALRYTRARILAGGEVYEPLYIPLDHVHPNAAGYRVIAGAALETLRPLLATRAEADGDVETEHVGGGEPAGAT